MAALQARWRIYGLVRPWEKASNDRSIMRPEPTISKKSFRGDKIQPWHAVAPWALPRSQKKDRPPLLAATNKCLAQSNKSRTGGKATKRRTRARSVIGNRM